MCSKRRKNHGCGQTKPKSTSSAIFGVETAAKSCELKRCADRVWTEPTRQIWTFCLNFNAEFLSPRLNFSPSTKKTTECSFELFFPLTNLFLTFVVFACFATTRVNMRFRAENTRIQHRILSSVGSVLVALWCGRTDAQTDGHVTTTSLPKFFGLIDYQISLAMELRWCASALAPLLLLLLWYGDVDLTLFQRGYEKCLFFYFLMQKIRVNDNPLDDDIGVAFINICTIQRYIKKLR